MPAKYDYVGVPWPTGNYFLPSGSTTSVACPSTTCALTSYSASVDCPYEARMQGEKNVLH